MIQPVITFQLAKIFSSQQSSSTENNNQTIFQKIFCQKSSDLLSSLNIPSHDANDDDNDDPDDDWRICQDIPCSVVEVEGQFEVNNESVANHC